MRREMLMIGAGAVAVVALLILAQRINAAKLGQAAGQAAADAASGAIIGIGSGLGIPAADATQCQADLAAGKTWDASFSCPAGTFLKSFIGLS
jgi:hypothetical protein